MSGTTTAAPPPDPRKTDALQQLGSGLQGAEEDKGHDEHQHAATAAGATVKRLKTAQALALLAGYGAELTDDDAGRPMLVISRWALTKSFTDATQAEAWLAQVTGRADVLQGG